MADDELLTTKQAAEYAGLSKSHIQYLIRNKKITGRRLGSKVWVTTKAEIDAYLASNPQPGPKKKEF